MQGRNSRTEDSVHLREGLLQLKYGNPKFPVRQIETLLINAKGNVGKVMEALMHETPDKNMFSSKDDNHLDSRAVRWFYKKTKPKAELKWVPFDVNDSLLLELRHRVFTKQIYPDAKPKDVRPEEESIDSVDLGSDVLPKSPKLLSKFNNLFNQPFSTPTEEKRTESQENTEEESSRTEDFPTDEQLSKRVTVLNGYYEVDLEKRICLPIYWPEREEEFKVMRQMWFYEATKGSGEWLPLEEERLGEEVGIRCWLK